MVGKSMTQGNGERVDIFSVNVYFHMLNRTGFLGTCIDSESQPTVI